MKNATTKEFRDLQQEGGSWIPIIAGKKYGMFFPGIRTVERLPLYIDALISRLEKDDKDCKLAKALKEIQKPFDIWFWNFKSKEKRKSFWGKEKTVEVEKIQALFVFKQKLTEQEIVAWNMWIMGYWTRPLREFYDEKDT